MQIFKNMLMLHTVSGEVVGWCGLNDGDGGAVVQVEVHGAPPGQMEVTLFTKEGEHPLGVMEASGKNAQANWRFAGSARDVTGIRIAHQAVQYVIKGGNAIIRMEAPKMPGARQAPATPKEPPPQKKPEAPAAAGIPKKAKAPAAHESAVTQDKAREQKAMPHPAEKKPDGKKPVRENENVEEKVQQAMADARFVQENERMLAQADMRLSGETDGYSYAKAAKKMMAGEKRPMPAKPPREKTMPARKEFPIGSEMPGSGRPPLAQADMRLYGQTDGNGSGNPIKMPEAMPQVRMQQLSPVESMPPMEAGAPVDPNERIRELLAQAEEDMSNQSPETAVPEEAPLPLMKMPAQAEPKSVREKISPELIEVLSLSDVSGCGVEDGLLGEGSGREGVLGKGVWWRVEQPGVQDWHYLAGELTAKNGSRVRAIALAAECGELPEHLRGWAQRIEDYFVVLIDAKTGTVLPDSAC